MKKNSYNKRLVIIGGGFAGTKVAKALENKFKTTLIDTKDYFEFTPSVLKVLTNKNYSSKIQKKHSKYLKNTNILLDQVIKISKNKVITKKQEIDFDYLVISSGSDYSLPIKEKNITLPSRIEHLNNSEKKFEKSNNITIIGGGVVGIELAAEIKQNFKEKQVSIYTKGNSILERNNPKTQRLAKKILQKLGVKIHYQIEFKTNETKNAKDLIYFCVGIKPNSQFLINSSLINLSKNNQVLTNEFLQTNEKNIFAAGDIRDSPEEKTAQSAQEQAKIIIKNIINLENKTHLKKYSQSKKPMIITLGKSGIFEHKNFTYYGKIPVLIKKFIEKKTMLSH